MRGLVGLVALALMAASCGSEPDSVGSPSAPAATSPVTEVATTAPTGATDAPTSTPTPAADEPTTTTPPPTTVPPTEGTAPAVRAPLCSEVELLAPDAIGSLPGTANIDPVVNGVLLTYAQENAATFAGLWIDRDHGGTIVLAVTDDPDRHLDALLARRPSPDDVPAQFPPPSIVDARPLAEQDVTIDTVRATWTEAELHAAQQTIHDALAAGGFEGQDTGIDIRRNRVSIHLGFVSEDDLTALAALDPEGMLCVEGRIGEPPPPIEPGTELDVIPQPGSDPEVTCGGSGAFRLSSLATAVPVEETDPELRDAVRAALAEGEGAFQPQDGWVVLALTAETAQLARFADDGAFFMGFRRTAAGWAWDGMSGGGPCLPRVVLPAGLGTVRWELDPAFPVPAADDVEIHLLVTEAACTGGQAMGERLLGPEMEETAEAVLIAFAAISPTGDQTCPGNPSAPVTVVLAAPLGERSLRDGLELDLP